MCRGARLCPRGLGPSRWNAQPRPPLPPAFRGSVSCPRALCPWRLACCAGCEAGSCEASEPRLARAPGHVRVAASVAAVWLSRESLAAEEEKIASSVRCGRVSSDLGCELTASAHVGDSLCSADRCTWGGRAPGRSGGQLPCSSEGNSLWRWLGCRSRPAGAARSAPARALRLGLRLQERGGGRRPARPLPPAQQPHRRRPSLRELSR